MLAPRSQSRAFSGEFMRRIACRAQGSARRRRTGDHVRAQEARGARARAAEAAQKRASRRSAKRRAPARRRAGLEQRHLDLIGLFLIAVGVYLAFVLFFGWEGGKVGSGARRRR